MGAMERLPIGIFDSGVGGLTVLKSMRKLLPGEDFIYFGDTARVPYGTKSERTIIRYSLENARFLKGIGIKALVVACNTSSAYAIDILKEELEVPVIGVIKPGASAAVRSTKSGSIGVIGTNATIKSRAYTKEILALNPFARVVGRACPLLVPIIEEGLLNDEVTRIVIRRYLDELVKEVDTVVLGCTHYPLIKDTLKEIYTDINFVDSADETAKAVREAIGSGREREGKVRILVSDRTERFERIARMILEDEIEVEEVAVDKE